MAGKRGTVLIVEDSSESRDALTALVEREGFKAVACGTSESGLASFARERPTAVLVGRLLPDGSGTEVCRAIRARDAVVTVVFVGGHDDEASVVRGLQAGADDYVRWPDRGGELIARLEAQLRKLGAVRAAGMEGRSEAGSRALRFGDLTLDLGAHEAMIGQHRVKLGPVEARLLECLARTSGVAVSRDQIMTEVYGGEADTGTDRVDQLVRRLRAKLGDDDGQLIAGGPGFGYRLDRRAAP